MIQDETCHLFPPWKRNRPTSRHCRPCPKSRRCSPGEKPWHRWEEAAKAIGNAEEMAGKWGVNGWKVSTSTVADGEIEYEKLLGHR